MKTREQVIIVFLLACAFAAIICANVFHATGKHILPITVKRADNTLQQATSRYWNVDGEEDSVINIYQP